MIKERVAYFDILRAFAIVGVIAIHSLAIDCHFDNANCNFTLAVLYKQIVNFSVPLFLALSGFFLANKKVEHRIDYLKFLKIHIIRVLIPFIIWSVFYISIDYTIRGASLKSVFVNFISFQAAPPFYFILLIIQCYLLLPLLKKMATIKGIVCAGIISVVSCLLIFYFRYYTSIEPPLFIYGGSLTTWIVFYVLGIYIRKNGISIRKSKLLTATVLSLALSLFATIFLCIKYHNMGYAATATKISAFAYSFALILYLFKFKDRNFKQFKLLSFIGEVSFGIFLSHMFVLQCISHFCNIFTIKHSSSDFLCQLISILFTLACCAFFAYVARKINKPFATKFLGQ